MGMSTMPGIFLTDGIYRLGSILHYTYMHT